MSGLQTAPAWHFTSVSCQEDTNPPTPITVAQNPTVTVNNLLLAHNYSCTFTNTQDADIPFLKKVNGSTPSCNSDTKVCTDPVSGQTIPVFTMAMFPQGTYPPSTPLGSVTGPPFQASLPGAAGSSFTICETGLPAGWNLATGDVTIVVTMFGGATGTITPNPAVSNHDTVTPASVNRCFDITVPAGADKIEITVNNKAEGKLKIVKQADGGDDTFTFGVSGGPTAFNSPISLNTANNNPGAHQDSTSEMPALIGNYTITETTLPNGWSLKDLICTGPDGATVSTNKAASQITAKVIPGTTTVCTYTDTKFGHLIVKKVTDPASDTTTQFPILASGIGTITAPAARTLTGGSSTDYEVTEGTYSVTETVPAGWDQTGNTCTNVVVATGEVKTCEITNTQRGHLIVQKTTNPSGDPTVFSINASGGGTITGGGAGSVTDALDKNYEVTPGTYSVTETVPAGWDMNTNACQGVVVGAGEIKTCEITNTKRGHLIVQKTTNPAGDPTVFSINASGTGSVTGGGAGTVTDALDKDYEVVPGTYSATETVPAGWDLISNTCQSVAVGAGEIKTCEITNTKRAHLIVQKTTNPAGDPTVFSINASGSGTIIGGGAGTVTDALDQEYLVTPGIYSVAENVPSGWDQTSNTCTGVAVAAGVDMTCVITNTRKGHLIVTKVTEPASDTTTQFPVTASGTGAITAPAARTLIGNGGSTDYEVAAGIYSVAENVPAGWSQTGNTCQNVIVPPGQIVNCRIGNSQFGHLVVVKQVINDNGGTQPPSAFTMSVTGNSPSPASFPGGSTTVALIAGSYSVSETGPSGYASSFSADCSGSIAGGETKTCTVTNDDIQPKLIVIKVVVNDNGGTATPSSFTMNVTGNGPSPSSFAGGSGTTVALNAGSYSVSETAQIAYAASLSAGCSERSR